MDDDRPIVNIGDELCIVSLSVKFPEDRCKIEGGEDRRQGRALTHPDCCRKRF